MCTAIYREWVGKMFSGSRDRRGLVVVAAAAFLVAMIALAAFVVDVGHWYAVRGELQNSADASAIAAAQRLATEELVSYDLDYALLLQASRQAASTFAGYNKVELEGPELDVATDITFGRVDDITDPDSFVPTTDPSQINAVRVRVRKTSAINGPAMSFFSKIWGYLGLSMSAEATAILSSSIVGFQINSEIGYAKLLPFAVDIDDWNELVAGNTSDEWRWSSEDNQAYCGEPDGIYETSLYPLENLTAGNFGTVDIGSPNNSTADLIRQIRYGISQEDLAYLGGKLELGEDGVLTLNGDTGLSSAIRSALEEIIGQPRVIPLYSTVEGVGNNATYTIVGFAGIRILDVKLTGPLSQRRVVIQPAVVVDESALIGDTPAQSYYVFSVVRLVR